MESILQSDKSICYLCRRPACGDPLDKHHIFGASNRKNSERYGLTVYLHHRQCHIFGNESVHKNAEIRKCLQAIAQKIAMEYHGWTEDDFRRIFGKSYI